MMLDEPYRFAEAVSNRRDYIEDQLRGGSPVVGMTCADGILLVTMGRGQQKLHETYDRIAMGSVGHPTDIEKLRQSAVDLASVVGFNYSDADVTLQQIVHFGLGPAVKASFDDIIRSPYIVRILLAELVADGTPLFYTVDYDGTFTTYDAFAVVGGSTEADTAMNDRLSSEHDADADLQSALQTGLRAWASGRFVGLQEDDAREGDATVSDEDVAGVLKSSLEDLTLEAGLLNPDRPAKTKYLPLTAEETQPAIEALIA